LYVKYYPFAPKHQDSSLKFSSHELQSLDFHMHLFCVENKIPSLPKLELTNI
jgi:hypothetical protein